jgi:hypothetical protein
MLAHLASGKRTLTVMHVQGDILCRQHGKVQRLNSQINARAIEFEVSDLGSNLTLALEDTVNVASIH